MDNRKVKLAAAGQTQVRGNIKRIVIRRASGPVFIETDQAEAVEAIQGDNILFEKACKVMTVTDTSGFQNELTLLLVGSSEGDVSNAAGTVEIANTDEIGRAVTTGAATCDIRKINAGIGGVQVLAAGVNRRMALVSTSGPVQFATSAAPGGQVFVIDGVLEYPALGELWAFGTDSITIEVMEFIN